MGGARVCLPPPTGDGSCCAARNWEWGEQNLGLGMENRDELVGRIWLERWVSEHDSGGQTLAETPRFSPYWVACIRDLSFLQLCRLNTNAPLGSVLKLVVDSM